MTRHLGVSICEDFSRLLKFASRCREENVLDLAGAVSMSFATKSHVERTLVQCSAGQEFFRTLFLYLTLINYQIGPLFFMNIVRTLSENIRIVRIKWQEWQEIRARWCMAIRLDSTMYAKCTVKSRWQTPNNLSQEHNLPTCQIDRRWDQSNIYDLPPAIRSYRTTQVVGEHAIISPMGFVAITVLLAPSAVQYQYIKRQNWTCPRVWSTATFLIWSICREHQRITLLGW